MLFHQQLSVDSDEEAFDSAYSSPSNRHSVPSRKKEERTPFSDLLEVVVRRIKEEHEREVYLMRRALEDCSQEVDRLRLARLEDHRRASLRPVQQTSEHTPPPRPGSAAKKLSGVATLMSGARMSGGIFSIFNKASREAKDGTDSRPAAIADEYTHATSLESSLKARTGSPNPGRQQNLSHRASLPVIPSGAQLKQPGSPPMLQAPLHETRSSPPLQLTPHAIFNLPPDLPQQEDGSRSPESQASGDGEKINTDANESTDSEQEEDHPDQEKVPAPPTPNMSSMPMPPPAPPPELLFGEGPSTALTADGASPEQQATELARDLSLQSRESKTPPAQDKPAVLMRSDSSTNQMKAAQRSCSSGVQQSPEDLKMTSATTDCSECSNVASDAEGSAEDHRGSVGTMGSMNSIRSGLGALNAISEEHEHHDGHEEPSEAKKNSNNSDLDVDPHAQQAPSMNDKKMAKRSLPRIIGWQDKEKKGSILKKQSLVQDSSGKKKTKLKTASVLWAPETDEQEELAESRYKEEMRLRESCPVYEGHNLNIRPRWKHVEEDGLKKPPPMAAAGQSRASIWATIDQVDGVKDPGESSRSSSRPWSCSINDLVSHPNSRYNFYFDVFSFILVGYDFVMVPLDVFDPEQTLALEVMMAISTLWWTFDCLRNFLIGYYSHGEVVMQFRRIACRYIKTWFSLDVIIVSFDWVFQILKYGNEDTEHGAARIFRSLRNIRGLRLLRGIKAGRLLKMFEDRIQSEALSVIFTMGKLFSAILIMNHVIACIWYLIGKLCQDTMPNWIDKHLHDIKEGQYFVYRYSTSFHWALTQFTPASISVQPYNFYERFFAIVVLLFALVTVSTFVSGITSAVMQLRSMRSAKSKQLWLLRRYLAQCNVPTPLAVRINNYCDYAWGAHEMRLQERNIQILTLLSQSLRAELKAAIYEPRISKHPFFVLLSKVAPLTTRTLCSSAVSRIEVGRSDQLFAYGDTADKMYFISMGELVYFRHDLVDESEVLTTDSWFCEPVLWTFWTYQGTLQSKIESVLSAVDAEKFGEIVQSNYDSRSEAAAYAKGFIQGLNRIDATKLSDLYTTPLVEGLWFRLLNEFQFKRSTAKRSRATKDKGSAASIEDPWFTKFARLWRRRDSDRIEPYGP